VAHPAARYPDCLQAGIVPLAPDSNGLRFLCAPRGEALAHLARALANGPADGIALTTPAHLRAFAERSFASTIQRHAADGLADRDPSTSARDGISFLQHLGLAILVGAIAVSATLDARTTLLAVSLLFSLLFLANILVRLSALRENGATPGNSSARVSDADLPTYTILVPLYRETRVLGQIVKALLALNYPLAKLDIKLLLEADDIPMQRAVAAMRLPGAFEVVVAPRGSPRTKPRALNVGLATARGEFLVIYDAEDRPEPGQLRAAVSRFRAAGPRLGCLQGRLVIDNTDDSWLTRLFTIEYAALFGVLVPGLAALRLPVMLGGTTNHFRVDVLRRVGGWDAWNVTEDADLGFRLARSGYDVADLPLATLEEAPANLRAWLAQRTRWMKGWMQTAAVHARHPRRAIAAMGVIAYASSLSICFGTVAAALFGPFFFVAAALEIVSGNLLRPDGIVALVIASISLTLFAAGIATTVATALEALRRQHLKWLAPWLLALPGYYLLVTAAAWRALGELIVQPQQWNKTEHGLARTSRTAGVVAPAE
jgi:cellulose synthase/poly-beta-1,6-N-acetylglucosamine synthase-like glycosyltransferase